MKKNNFYGLLLLSVLISYSQLLQAQSNIAAVKLRTEYLENPIGIDNKNPQFSWLLNDGRRGAVQTAYQLLVASSAQELQSNQGDIWDSQKVSSDESVHVIYKGLALKSGTKYFWKVKVWDLNGKPSNWSEPATFEMGLLNTGDWKAEWIGRKEEPKIPKMPEGNWIWHPQAVSYWHMVYFRKNFQIPTDKPVTKVWIKTAIDNAYELKYNQNVIATVREFQPTRGQRFFLYDVTRFAKFGDNLITVAAVQTQPGEQGGFICTLQVEYADGSTLAIVSDDSWMANSIDRTGWIPDLPISRWVKARIVEPYGGVNWKQIQAPYIPPQSQMLRKEFSVRKKISQARIYVSGLGGYYLYLNGKQIGTDVFAPGLTNYPKRIQYQTYDVTNLLQTGNNAIGSLLGNLWWSGDIGWRGIGQFSEGPLRFLMQLRIMYVDGTSELIVTDKNWRIRNSPITFNSIYDGESYDARLEVQGWNQPGLQEKDWLPVEIIPESKQKLIAEQIPPVQVTNELQPETMIEVSSGKYIFDMGQNIAGWARIKINAPAGTKITLRFAETLNPDGSLKTEPLRTAKATDEYISAGREGEVWEPKFTYHGFQYVELTGMPGRVSRDQITGIVINNNIPERGQFACSNPLLMKIQNSVKWGLRGNMIGVITDCPQRDERLGWIGDVQIFAPTALYNRDMTSMFIKYMRDITDSQREDGDVLNINPNAFNEGPAQAGWADAVVLIPWHVYQFSGDKRILEENYPAMVKWHKKKQAESKGFLREIPGFGDWLSVVPTPPEPIGSAYYYYSTKILGRIAEVLGRPEDAKNYAILADKIAQAYNEKHFDKQSDSYESNTQTANVLPLAFGITPVNVASNVAENVVNDIKKHNNHLSTGLLGTQYLLPVLSQYGYHDIAFQLATQWTYPSWGYMIENKATTLWEAWDSDKKNADLSSRNHYALGTIGEWFYAYLAGIRPVDETPGFKKILLTPRPVGNITWAVSAVDSHYGMISCRWERKDNRIDISIVVPPNTTAEVVLPATSVEAVKESNTALGKVAGIKNIKVQNKNVTFEISSGRYAFVITQ
jgi:alpha-L-rhamnosidase